MNPPYEPLPAPPVPTPKPLVALREPPRVDLCPRRRVASVDDLTLAKCCLLERGVECEGTRAVVPWGSNLDEIRAALRQLTGVGCVSGVGSPVDVNAEEPVGVQAG